MRPDTQRGMVLIVVLVLLAGLSLLLADFSRLLLAGRSVSAVSRTMLSAKPLFASGERLAAQLLLQKKFGLDSDSPQSPWSKDFPGLLQEISDALDAAEISGEIVDENSLFPLQAMFARTAREQAKAHLYANVFARMTARLLLLRGLAGSDEQAADMAEEFTEALLRWGGGRGVSAVPDEPTCYIEGKPSHIPPRTRLLSPDELLLVRWERVEEQEARKLILGDPEIPGLADLVSVWSTGPMNINTLHPIVLESLLPPGERGQNFALYIQTQRSDPENPLGSDWYKEAALNAVQSSDEFPFSCVGVRSFWFRVKLSVSHGAARAGCVSVCKASGRKVQWVARTFY